MTESYLGWVTSAYSLGRLLASIVFGYWSDKRRAMESLIVSIVLLIVGSILYCCAQAFGDNGLYVVLIARTMQGMSSGTNCSSRHWRCCIKTGVLINFAKFTGKRLRRNLLFNKVTGLEPQTCSFVKKQTPNFAKFLRASSSQSTSERLLLKLLFMKVSTL